MEIIRETLSYPIRLGQFLKLINAAQDGFEARILIQEGKIRVNGELEKRRGRKLQKQDMVEVSDGTTYLLQ
ncbi:RNA-binding S4 domain-containing protein [Desulfopila inferna]|uniref:RNA-binding S4 domain-containing protein n=1 Tax=Desulfopila inferna TaxID=468528 RepID=UPI001965C336|nr:RNA-binding S4 domain-containing protein [Desulfopila inferna]MBM9602935.1 RNA-binding S4 domain-containing protein [Desulfopila inferna]